MRKTKCFECGKMVELGLDAVAVMDGIVCDTCAGVERDLEGYAWFFGEETHDYVDLDGENPHTITRAEAFGLAEAK